MDDTDGDADASGDGSAGPAAFAAGENGGAFVVVRDGVPASTRAAGSFEAVLGPGGDAASPVFGQVQTMSRMKERWVCSPAAMASSKVMPQLEQVVQDGEPFEEDGPVLGGEPAADLLLEDLPADGFERIVLPAAVLLVGAHPQQADQRHRMGAFGSPNTACGVCEHQQLMNGQMNNLGGTGTVRNLTVPKATPCPGQVWGTNPCVPASALSKR